MLTFSAENRYNILSMMKNLIEIPTNCPECGSQLERVKGQLFCRNSSCSGTLAKKVIHFAKTMKIKGLGEKSVQKLELSSILDIYSLTTERLHSILGEKVGNKLLAEIEKSKTNSLAMVIAGLSIPLVGKTAANKLITTVSSLKDFTAANVKNAGLGPTAVNNIIDWLSKNDWVYSLPISTIVNHAELEVKKETGISVCVSGKIDGYTRDSIKKHLENLGVKLVSTVSKNTNYLISEVESSSSKTVKAKQLEIPIITLKQLETIILETKTNE